jgi:hypothetical protein
MRKLLLSTIALLALSGAAKADFVTLGTTSVGTPIQWDTSGMTTLTLSQTVPGGNQPRNIACLICGENQPQQPAGFGYNDFNNTGGINTIDAFSSGVFRDHLADTRIGTGYTVGAGDLFRLALLGRSDFSVGVDINDTNQAQILESFWFLNLTQHTVLAAFSPGPGGTAVPSQNNGTGFPDYTLSGFDLNRGDIRVGDEIIFFARMSNMNDGPDSFFLTQQVAAVPELSTWAMFIIGFMGIGGLAMRKKGQLRLA